MEGRTKFNYGMQGQVLSIEDLNYMISIIESQSRDIIKANKLYAFCNYHTLLMNRQYYEKYIVRNQDIKAELMAMITKLITTYQYYDKKGYFDLSKNRYKCTLEELEVRLLKINEVSAIINSDENDYIKAEKLLLLFDSSESFRKAYSLFIKFGENDSRLSTCRKALDEFDTLLEGFRDLEKRGIVDYARYILKIEDFLHNYDYAKFVISNYIESSDSYKKRSFLEKLGIEEDVFNFCVDTIEELDVDLYKKYLAKKEKCQKIRCVKIAEGISDIANGIKTGMLADGTPFDLLEFIKRVPFKDCRFLFRLDEFMKRYNPHDYNVVMAYISKNKLHKYYAFRKLDLSSIYGVKTTVNGVEVTKEDIDTVIEYLRLRDIPLISATFVFAREKYLNGEITQETLEQLRINNAENQAKARAKSKTLIPSSFVKK